MEAELEVLGSLTEFVGGFKRRLKDAQSWHCHIYHTIKEMGVKPETFSMDKSMLFGYNYRLK